MRKARTKRRLGEADHGGQHEDPPPVGAAHDVVPIARRRAGCDRGDVRSATASQPQIQRGKGRVDRYRRAVRHRFARGGGDVSRWRSCSRLASGGRPSRMEESTSRRPSQERWLDRIVFLPRGVRVAPDLEALRIPVIPEEVRGALRAVQLERRSPVALDRLARDDGREDALAWRRMMCDTSRSGLRSRRRGPLASQPRPPPRRDSTTGPRSAVRLRRL